MTSGPEVLRDRLRALREGTWDASRGLERVPAGVAPGVDLAALGLHIVRESAFGALADLADGRADRAGVALDAVVALQLDAPGRPWDGTFPVTAEQPPPPEVGGVEWIDWDPNWRQFVGTALALAVERHGPELGAARCDRLVAAVVRSARGEPDDRIPPWYTNPDLLHAWVAAWAGVRTGAADLVATGEARAARALGRVAAAGDVDEYSSPTYDGVDLVAAGLWATHPPTPAFAVGGARLLGILGPRISTLFHPDLGAMCGPYIRAYGLGLDRYVALVALWLVAAGADPATVLPWPLEEATDHVHDLWSTALVAAVAPAVVPHLRIDRALPRRHVQRVGPVEAVSVLTAEAALGAERGRRPEFARDQHVPVTVHTRDAWLGVAPGDGVAGIDAEVVDERTIAARVVAAAGTGAVAVRTLWSAEPHVDGATLTVAGVSLRATPAPTSVALRTEPRGTWATLTWPPTPSPTFTVADEVRWR